MIRCAHTRRPAGVRRPERGAALVEFALVSLVLYLLLAGTIEFGRLMFDANALQDVARVAARELAVAPIRADVTFDYALSCDPASDANCLVDLKSRIFDPACLVVDLNDPAVAPDPDGFFAAMPVVNRALRTLMITEPSRPKPPALCGRTAQRRHWCAVQCGWSKRPGCSNGLHGRDPARQLTRRDRRRDDYLGAGRGGDPGGAGFELSLEGTLQSRLSRRPGRVRSAGRRPASRPRTGRGAHQLSLPGGDAQRFPIVSANRDRSASAQRVQPHRR